MTSIKLKPGEIMTCIQCNKRYTASGSLLMNPCYECVEKNKKDPNHGKKLGKGFKQYD
jgi:hypothetical protein